MNPILFLLACGEPTHPPPLPVPVAVTAAPAEVVRPLPAKATTTGRGTAPTRGWQGLEVGSALPADIDAWTASHGLSCPGAVAPRRVQFRYGCTVPAAQVESRKIGNNARVALMLVRSAWHDPAPPGPAMEPPADPDRLYFLNIARRYSTPEGVAEDYAATVAALTATYGAPVHAAPLPGAKALDAKIVRFATDWSFDDLSVTVTVTRFSQDWAVAESYTDPGLSSTIPDRGGPAIHGGAKSAKNPHLQDDAPAVP